MSTLCSILPPSFNKQSCCFASKILEMGLLDHITIISGFLKEQMQLLMLVVRVVFSTVVALL
jgi:hypothetical protein